MICDRYFENAPTVGLIDISLSLTTISIWVLRWPMSFRASSDRPRHQRSVTDDDRDALHAVPQVACLGQAFGDREPGAGVPAIEHVVRRFGAAREATDAIERAQCPEPLEPARQELVRVRLVTGVPDDPVTRRLEETMQGDRQLDHAKGRAEMAARLRDGRDDRLADIGSKLGELCFGQAAKVRGSMDLLKDRHAVEDSDEDGWVGRWTSQAPDV